MKWCPEAESNHRHGDFQFYFCLLQEFTKTYKKLYFSLTYIDFEVILIYMKLPQFTHIRSTIGLLVDQERRENESENYEK